jgi:hypothetical protein
MVKNCPVCGGINISCTDGKDYKHVCFTCQNQFAPIDSGYWWVMEVDGDWNMYDFDTTNKFIKAYNVVKILKGRGRYEF